MDIIYLRLRNRAALKSWIMSFLEGAPMHIGIATRFGLALVGVSLAAAAAVGISLNAHLTEMIRQAEKNDLEGRFVLLSGAIAASADKANAMASLVAALPEVAETVAAGDRALLGRRMTPVFDKLAKPFAIEQFQFHLPPATSFLRAHAPGKFGDDLSKIRETVVRTNASRQPTHGLETGVAGLGVRAVVPLFAAGRHVGSVEFGLSFGKPFFDDFKAVHGVDAALLILEAKGGGFKMFAGTVAAPRLDSGELAAALAGETVVRTRTVDGIRTAILGWAIADYSGRPFGVVELAMNAEAYADQLNQSCRTVLMLVAGIVALSAAISAVLARGITGPIRSLTGAMQRISGRDFAVNLVGLDRQDEIGHMARAIEVVRGESENLATMEAEQKRLVAELRDKDAVVQETLQRQLTGIVDAAVQSNEAGLVIAACSPTCAPPPRSARASLRRSGRWSPPSPGSPRIRRPLWRKRTRRRRRRGPGFPTRRPRAVRRKP